MEELLKFLLFLFSGFAVFLITQLLIILIKIYAKPTKRKISPLKTKLLKKLRKQAKQKYHIYAFIYKNMIFYAIDCDGEMVDNYGTRKQEALSELRRFRIEWILQQVEQYRQAVLYKELENVNDELMQL